MQKQLKILRQNRRLKVADMAKMLDISMSYYYKIESGARNPTILLAKNICNIVGGSVDEVFLHPAWTKCPKIIRSIWKAHDTYKFHSRYRRSQRARDFKIDFNNLILERIKEIRANTVIKNPEYVKYADISFEYYLQVIKSLPNNSEQLIYKFEQAEYTLNDIVLSIVYLQGLKDGIKIKNK